MIVKFIKQMLVAIKFAKKKKTLQIQFVNFMIALFDERRYEMKNANYESLC